MSPNNFTEVFDAHWNNPEVSWLFRHHACLGGAFWSSLSTAAHAQATPFYKDKTIRIIVGFTSGGLYDQYARILSRHMSKFIPGNPSILVQNMPGAGSLTATNYVYGVAKPDGLTLGMPGSGIYLDQMLGRKEATFDVAKLSWIGSVDQRDLLLYMRAEAPWKSIEDVMNVERSAQVRLHRHIGSDHHHEQRRGRNLGREISGSARLSRRRGNRPRD